MMRKFIFLLSIVFSLSVNAQEKEKQMTFSVPEMNCQLCVYLVNKEVRNVEGVKTSKASIKERKVTVFSDSEVSHEAIIDAIHRLNYSATLVE